MNTGDITGRVSDPTGSIIVAATNGDGQYLLAGLAPGAYKVTASATGFKQALADHVSLHLNEHLDRTLACTLATKKNP